MAAEDELKSCQGCGATVYPEHIEAGRAAYWAGQLLCAVCLKGKQSAPAEEAEPVEVVEVVETEDVSLSLVDESELESSGRRVIQAFKTAEHTAIDESKLQRSLNKTGTGATRMKVFHTKMTDGAVEFMEQNVNEWIDGNPDVEIKFVESTVGLWEGKHSEPHLILTLWY